ncbi:MAG: hypothetical protein KF803_07120 [Cyclobacteriaceae bacterium]|nr:hypothetical protein [Cyclobacteriaceae bacterium]
MKGCVNYIILILILSRIHAGAQQMFPYHLDNNLQWSAYEKMASFEEKRSVVNQLQEAGLFMEHYPSLNEMIKGIHFIDFNGDSKNEIVYNGSYPGEGTLLLIFMQTDDSWARIFSTMGEIIRLNYNSGIIYSLDVSEPGCCADPTTVFKTYRVSTDNRKIFIDKIFESKILTGTDIPHKFFRIPTEFEILNEKYFLRSGPEIMDEPFDDYLEQYGNQIGKLSAGTQGRALGESTDSTGRVWWFVEIYPRYKIADCVFYSDEYYKDFHKTHIVGWISSRFVKKLD